MRLLCIIEATTVNGPAKNLLSFCRLVRSPELCANGIPRLDVSIVTFHRSSGQTAEGEEPDAAPNSFVATAREMGITVDVITERFRFDPRVLSQLRAIVARRAPDVIQTHMIKSHFLVKFAGFGKQYPWVAYHHGYTTTDLKMRAYNQLNRWSLPSASRVVAACGAFAKQLTQSGLEKDLIAVVHNSVAPPRNVARDEQQHLRDRFGLAADERVVIAVGRLSAEKGHADLIYGMSALRELCPELRFKLLIVGEGPELQDLQRSIGEQRLDGQVIFVGHVDDVAPFYAIADVLALPSHSEGSPNVLLEAMAAGVPVVATRVGGIPEIAVSEEHALLVPARDPQLFAEALHRVLTQPDLAQTLRANALARAADFSPTVHAHSLIRIVEELVSKGGAVAKGSAPRPYSHDSVSIPISRDSDSLSF